MPSRLNWSIEEEDLLKALKEVENFSSWKKIAQILNDRFLDSSRSGKQCRDRYINYVRFGFECPKIMGWTIEEDRALFEKFQEYGSKWVLISSQMPGRSENNLKNRFYGAMRKIMRKMAKVQKELKPKPKKSIKERQLIKIFEECRSTEDLFLVSEEIENFPKFCGELYNKLLVLAISQEQEISHSEVKCVINMIHLYSSVNSRSIVKNKSFSSSSLTGDSEKIHSVDEILNNQQIDTVEYEKERCLPTYCQIDEKEQENSIVSWSQIGKNNGPNYQADISDFSVFQNQLLNDFGTFFNDNLIPEAREFFF